MWGVFGTSYLLFASGDLGLGPAAIGVIAGWVAPDRSPARSSPAGRSGAGRRPDDPAGDARVHDRQRVHPAGAGGAWCSGAACLIVQQLVGDSAGTLFEITQVSLTQSVVEDRLLGRVNGSIRFFEDVFQLAGTIAGGVIAEVIGLRGAMAFGVLGGSSPWASCGSRRSPEG